MITLGVLTLRLRLPGCSSLKAKRSRLKPLLARLQKEFNVSAAEIDDNDVWQAAVIACVTVSNDQKQAQRALQTILRWLDTHQPDLELVAEQIEIIHLG